MPPAERPALAIPPAPSHIRAMSKNMDLPEKAIAEFCQRHHIRKLSLFGSVLRDDFGPDSDIDVLVEFEPGRVPGFAFFAMQDELAEMTGRPVDLATPQCLSRYIRDDVVATAEVCFSKP